MSKSKQLINMAEKKPKPKTSKKKKAQKPSSPQLPRTIKVSMADVHAVCSVTDPFCKHAIGARALVFGKSRTMAIPNHYRRILTTNATGYASALVLAQYNFQPVVVSASIIGGIADFTAAMTAGTPVSAAMNYRIVSFGVKIRNITAPLNASGMVHLRSFNAKDGSTFAAIDIATYNCDQYEDIPLQQCNEALVVPGRLDITATQLAFPSVTNPSNLPTAWVNPGWQVGLISVSGAPNSTNVLELEVITNYEITLADDNTLQQLAVPTPIVSPEVQAAVNTVSTEAKALFKTGALEFGKYVVRKATSTLASAIGARLGGPMGFRAARMITNVD